MPTTEHPTLEKFDVRDVAPKSWGREILVAHTEHYTGKVMYMRAGASGPLQYHEKKDESFYLHSGKLQIRTLEHGILINKLMYPGDAYHIPPGCVHQVAALEDSVMFETSTPVFNDRVPYQP